MIDTQTISSQLDEAAVTISPDGRPELKSDLSELRRLASAYISDGWSNAVLDWFRETDLNREAARRLDMRMVN